MNIKYQFECLSHSLRMQLEQIIKYPDLVEVDEKEAIYNVEIIVKSVLDAFHNVYDAIQKLSNKTIDFYKYPELHFILSIRNAKHHNKGIQSIFFETRDILYVNYYQTNSFPCIIYPIKWNYISNYILNEKKGRKKYESICKYLKMETIEQEVSLKNLNIDMVYINIIPLMLMAGKRLVELSKEYIPDKLNSTEACFFLSHFEDLSDDQGIEFKYPYNNKKYSEDIKFILSISERLSEINFNGAKNPYLEDIKYKNNDF